MFSASLIILATSRSTEAKDALWLLHQINMIESRLSGLAGHNRSARWPDTEGELAVISDTMLLFNRSDGQSSYVLRSLNSLSGAPSSSRGSGILVGNYATGGIRPLKYDEEIARALEDVFKNRRQEFRSTLVSGLVNFAANAGLVFDESTYSFALPATSVSEEDLGDRVKLTFFFHDLVSGSLVADVTRDGFVKLTLNPGVLRSERHIPQRTASEAEEVAIRNLENLPSGAYLIATLTYLPEPAFRINRNNDSSPLFSYDAYPLFCVRAYHGEGNSANPPLIGYGTVDGVTGQWLNGGLLMRLGGEDVSRIPVRMGSQTWELARGTAPPQSVFESMSLRVGGSHVQQVEVSTDGHYVRLLFGDYYSPKPIRPQTD